MSSNQMDLNDDFQVSCYRGNSFIIKNGRGNNTHEICLCWICQTFQNSWSWEMIIQGFKWLLFRGLFTIN